MNRDPSRYEGKEIYIGGEVLQALYDSDDPLKVQLRIGNSYNYYSDVMYVFYTLDKNEPRIIEGDYADIYGYFDGLITYESIMGENITIPSMRAEYLYNYPADGGGAYPEYEHADDLIRGVFVSEDGTEMSFPKNQSPDYYYFEHVEEYDDCLLVLYYPESALWGTDHPPLYHLIVFDDGRLVAFRENKTASSAHDGTYTYYEKTDAPAYTENPSDYAGTWESGRCHMDVTNSLGIYYVEINWASSASENTRYSFECTFDPESGCLTYVDGICCNEYYPDNGEMAETIVYSDGSGFFYVEDGYMYWEDSYGESLIFSKPY